MAGKRTVGDWLHVVGSIGIITSLVLVALQLRDANRIASGQMFSASIDSTISINVSQFGETPAESMVRVLYEPETAEVEDYYIANRIYDALFRILVRIHVFEDLGLYGSERVDPMGFVSVHYQLFACPYGLARYRQHTDVQEPQCVANTGRSQSSAGKTVRWTGTCAGHYFTAEI
jgi:hypothetical protein